MEIPLSEKSILLALPPQVPALTRGDAHLPTQARGLPLSSRPTLYLAGSQQGGYIWCVSFCLFLIPIHSFVSPPPLRLGSWWPPGSPVTTFSYLSEFASHGKETDGQGATWPCLSLENLVTSLSSLTLPPFLSLSFSPFISCFLRAC